MSAPVEISEVDDRAAHRGAVAAHELGERMDDDVGAVLDRPEQDRRRHRVVDDERDAVFVSYIGVSREVDDVAGGVADALAKDGACGLIDLGFDVGGAVARGEARPGRRCVSACGR